MIRGTQRVRLLLTRKPKCPSIQRGFIEKIAETEQVGQINVAWRPVSGDFEDTLAVFWPTTPRDYELERVADAIGPDDDAFIEGDKPPFIIGDGNGTIYKLTLTLDSFMRSELSDETAITVN